MNKEPINDKTAGAINDYLNSPGQSVGLVGQEWLNQGKLARKLAAQLLKISERDANDYPYLLYINNELPSIGIDEVRAINDFIALKVPGSKEIDRVIIVDQAEKMTLEAQNALLKNLEEPPHGTVFILNTASVNSLLPTITSRLHLINIYKPSKEALFSFYLETYEQTDINQAYLIADGLPELMDVLLAKSDNSYTEALASAKQLLTGSVFDRLCLINDLSKKKSELGSLFFVLKQMAKIGISSSDLKQAERWKRVLSATLKGERQLSANVQVKLLLTDFVLDT